MGQLDIGIIILFSLMIFVSGMSFGRSGKNMKSFFAAGGSVPWWINGLSLFMSFFSAGTFVVWGSIAYTHGWVSVTIQWTMAIAGLLIGLFIAPRWHRTKSLTAAEFITNRLGYNTQKIYTYLFLFISIFTTGGFLYPVAKIVEVSTGIPITASILFIGILIIIYTTVGGLWAVIVTDVLQFIVLTAAVIIIVPLSLKYVGGIDSFILKSPEGFFNLVTDEYSWSFILAFGLYNLFFIAGNWAYVQRYTSVSTPKDAKKVGNIFGLLYVVSPLVWMLPPMLFRVVNPELQGLADEGAYLLMCKLVLPAGMLGLILGGMVFATSSSVNTTLNISAGVITNDLYRHFFPESSPKKLVRVGRISTILLGILTIIVALLVPLMGGIVEVVLSVAALTGGAMYLPPLWAIFSKKQTGKSVLTITIVSLLINAYFKFLSPVLFDFTLSRAMEMGVGVFVPICLLVIYELYTRTYQKDNPDYQNYLKALEEKKSLQEESVDEDGNNAHGIKVIGFGIISTGLIITTLGLIANSGKFLVSGVGIFVLIVGLIIWRSSRRSLSKNKTT